MQILLRVFVYYKADIIITVWSNVTCSNQLPIFGVKQQSLTQFVPVISYKCISIDEDKRFNNIFLKHSDAHIC